MKFFKLIFSVLLVGYFTPGAGQSQDSFHNGYIKSLSGTQISYHAPDPRAQTALIVRSMDSTQFIKWTAESLAGRNKNDTIHFVWLFGMDATPEQHLFTLSFQGKDFVKFQNPAVAKKEQRKFYGQNGSVLRFRTTLIDRHKDAMGYAIFSLPAHRIDPDQPPVFSVRGESAHSSIWYMTFEMMMKSGMEIRNLNLAINEEGILKQAVLIETIHLGVPSKVQILGGGEKVQEHILETGYNAFRYYVRAVDHPSRIKININPANQEDISIDLTLEPVKEWTIYLVQHTHTDIGYTRPQSEILPEHLRFIDFALDYCVQTDDYPDDAAFRWTCESAWAVDEYIKRRPADQVKRLKKRIEEGRIEITAMPFNMSEIADEAALRMMLRPIKRFHQQGLKVSTAMQDDVNGIGWCLADFFPDLGIQYLVMGEHGHRALIPFDIPTAFWWESPSGKRLLTFRAEHYMYGNFLLLHTGEIDNFSKNLLNYLNELDEKNYPFNRIALQYSGFVTDNSPPSIIPNQLIREWNEKYAWPKLRSATASEFLKYVEKNHGDELPSYKKAWPDWWTDGFGSAARETAAVREAQQEMIITNSLLSMASVMGSNLRPGLNREINDIYKNILFYDEHTFGAAESITAPLSENSMDQWAEKSSYAWEALKNSRILREEAYGLLQEHIPRYDLPSITVFNTLSWKRSGPVSIYIDHEIVEPGQSFSFVDSNNEKISIQPLESRSDGTYWALWVEDMPAFGYQSFKIMSGEGQINSEKITEFTGKYEDQHWSVEIDPEDGSFIYLYNKIAEKQMVDQSENWKPGQLIYERLKNRSQLEHFKLEADPVRTSLYDIKFNNLKRGQIWNTISFTGKLKEGVEGPVYVEFRFFKQKPVIEMLYSMIKESVSEPESVYVSFPFRMENGQIRFEAQGGMVRPGLDQLSGTASDWNTVQNFVSVVNDEGQVVVSSPEIPLFQLGGLNIGNFAYHHQPKRPDMFSWVLNNYWTTNFRASQEGELQWRYFVTYNKDTTSMYCTKFGWNSSIPLIGRVYPGGTPNDFRDQKTVLSGLGEEMLITAIYPVPEANRLIIHAREISGQRVRFDPSRLMVENNNVTMIREVNAVGEPVSEILNPLYFEPFSIHFLEISWED